MSDDTTTPDALRAALAEDTLPGNPAAQLLLRSCPIFRRCTDEDLDALAGGARWRDLADGEDLVREGDAPEAMLIVASGRGRVLKRGADGVEHEINRVGAGDSIGEMALFDRVPRSATVRADGEVRCLELPLAHIVGLAETRPSLVKVLVAIGALVAERLRQAGVNAAATADRALAEERMRTVMGRFTLLLILGYSLYTWVLGTATQVKQSIGHSEFITVPFIIACCAILFAFLRLSGYPARFFGLTLENAGRHAAEGLLFTLPWLLGTVVLKLALVSWVPSMHGLPLLQMFSDPPPGMPASGFNPWLATAYVVFAPLQELIYRGGLQGSLAHFLGGRWANLLAIVGANLIFSAAHLYVSPGLALTAIVPGIFWGWMYARQRSLVGVSISHVLIGFWAFEVVDLGVLE